ncbi:MAG TPA: BamA/TamA family outer membrane protein [Steroidobacteraceae bacterium]|nr:BamA/TamA family outer membrane protein [Steroidobacteraceae bacterium]
MRCGRVTRLLCAIHCALWCLIAPACFAAIEIEVEGVTDALETNIREFLSLTRYATRDDIEPEVVTRLSRRIPAEVRASLEPLGYYAATAAYTLNEQPGGWIAKIVVDPGRAVRIAESTVEVVGEGKDDPALQVIVRRADLHPGARLDHGIYEGTKSELLRTATNNGYLEARLTQTDLLVDPTERRGTVHITLDTGARYHFGVIDVQQPVLKDEVARRLLRMKEGDPYTLDAVIESQYLFDDSQYFSAVEFEPGEPDRTTRTVPLSVRANKNRHNRYAVAAGYGTDTDARGKLTWDNRYLNRSGHRSQVQLTGSAIIKELAGKYIVPVKDVALEKFEIDASVREEELGDLLSQRIQLGFGLTQVYTDWQRVLFLRFSREDTEKLVLVVPPPPAGSPDPTTVLETDSKFLIIPGVSFATVPPNLLQRNRRRYSLYAELTGSPETLGSDASFLQLRLNGERVFDLNAQWRIRGRSNIGITWSDNFDTLPASHRFFAAGDNSVRGFGVNELSPRDPNTNQRVGGRYLVVGSVELERDIRNPWLNNVSGATFFDIGNAIDHFSDPLEYSVGVGLRYRLVGVASIGVDVAQALSESGRTPRIHLRLTTLF